MILCTNRAIPILSKPMESPSPSPVQLILNSSRTANSSQGSSSLGDITSSCSERESKSSTKTGLVSTGNGQRRSYGSVAGQLSSSLKRQHTFMIQHTLDQGDTLQGLALKYGVPVSDCVCARWLEHS